MSELRHRRVETNGIRLHIAEQGSGPLVILCHGFPESWYSWRHQLAALADAGFHAVAPDMRGFGRSSRPRAIEAYAQPLLVGDMVGLLKALGGSQAVIAGHDWGAPVAWNSALMRPDLFPAVIGLSVPYSPRSSLRPTDGLRALAGDDGFHYVLYFQEPGVAEAELEADPRHWLAGFFFSGSGDMPPGKIRFGNLPRDAVLSDAFEWPDALPAWLSEADLDFYAGEFERTGFRGGLNYYRSIDRSWELMAAYDGAPVRVPALFIAGDRDGAANRSAVEALPKHAPELRRSLRLAGCGHWTQQERPAEVNAAMIDFLRSL